jgi:cysteine-rich repeat protein
MKVLTSALSLFLLSSACTLLTRGSCGDNIVDQNLDEECDDGAKKDNDGCDKFCKIEAICGDGILDTNEACDDSNTSSNDGCSDDCQTVEPGFFCPNPGELCEDACGNGVLDPGEDCEPDQDNCNANCTFPCAINTDCEDNNGCTSNICDIPNHTCVFNPINISDEDDCTLDACDPSDGTLSHSAQNGTPCDASGSPGVCLTGLCSLSDCGDGLVDINLEECDDQNNINEDGCTNNCKLGPPCDDNEFGPFGSNATTDPNTGDCYIKVSPVFDQNWFGAETDCINHSGHLASIDNQQIQTLAEGVANSSTVWVGLTDEDVRSEEGVFIWTDGTPFVSAIFNNFASGEPDNANFGDCVSMSGSNDKWEDENCGVTHKYICEFH